MRPPRGQPKHKITKSTRQDARISPTCPRFSDKELKDLDVGKLMSTQFEWESGAKPFQVEATCAQLAGKNVIVHASTGSGKTAIAVGPHVVPAMKGMVTLFVALLLTLHTEMVKTFESKFKLKAVAVNSLIQKGTKALFKDIVDGKYQIVVLAPEMLLHRRFVDAVMKISDFRRCLLSVVIDEAHCISHWGESFRKLYGAIGSVRAFLLPHTPVVAMSGTLTRRVRRHICKKLGFLSSGANYMCLDEGNTRPNISVASLPMRHPIDSFRDADFIIPPNIHRAEDIEKTFVYCDDKDTIYSMVDHLRDRLPPAISPGVIRPFTASQSSKYREDAMAAFVAGVVRVLVCTEAAGMGCDISDVGLTVQWKTAHTMSGAVQRGGRTARGKDRTGVFIQLNEPASYRIDPTNPLPEKSPTSQPSSRGKRKRGVKDPKPKPSPESQTTSKQVDLGFKSAVPAEPELRDDSPGEGIYCFVQTTLCRRQIWDKVFGNTRPYALTVPCCDICDPSFLSRFHFTPTQKATRLPRVPKGDISQPRVQALKAWRDSTFERDYPTATWDSTAFMPSAFINILASVDPNASLESLTASFHSQWAHWTKYKHSIYAILSSPEPHDTPNHQVSTGSTTLHPDASNSGERQPKRPRLLAPSQPKNKSTNRKGKGKVAQYETVFDDWEVQPMVLVEETQIQATQAYSQITFPVDYPPTQSHPHPQLDLGHMAPPYATSHPQAMGMSSNFVGGQDFVCGTEPGQHQNHGGVHTWYYSQK
ncbi:hypothetical protein FRC08_000685 [Ceratobasidium sp. 394]|nr:hypothetical protein FRC08_000685 [Ceratobasidium sp. 394]